MKRTFERKIESASLENTYAEFSTIQAEVHVAGYNGRRSISVPSRNKLAVFDYGGTDTVEIAVQPHLQPLVAENERIFYMA